MTRPLIIDTDPGIDDAAAIAILFNNPEFDVRLIASVSGNVGIGHTTRNALKLLTFLGSRIPVARGAQAPLLRDNQFATEAHGKSGMGSFEFPEADQSLLLDDNAVLAERKVLMESDEPVTLLTIGPLTNIALLLATFPEVKSHIAEIIMMGGSTERGNIGVYGEFNISVDPHAAKMVFRSGIPVTMVGLDIGRKARLTVEDLDRMGDGGEVGRMVSDLFRSYDGGHIEDGVKMYDPSAAMFLLEPELFEVRDAFVDVEVSSPITMGATVVDFDGILGQAVNAKVCVDVDVDAFREHYVERVLKARRH
ncbi:ribonucleoside hydrolase RihC [Bifidobacterium bombi]|uniref:Ribonucleoside hydrolase RihC n=1 Tax=Bifidobacterium bombi DSM 19703 TaxID=1341695 RepID=A0A086BNJ5_9BIFI|nr:ribonucleoside hydrolase RihC [Bifidobacterium bombi]KFF30509.1 ribonucleoside hydrolase RihC [Bifidobacterium bombi DSM 19703]